VTKPDAAAGGRTDHVQSVLRAIDLLKAVAAASGSDASATALAHRCGLHRVTAWRLLMTLETQEMVTRNPRNGWFTLGPAVEELRDAVGRDSLVDAAHPVLERLALETGETACLGIVDGDEVHYVAEVIPDIASERSWLGERVQLDGSSMGKAFLAFAGRDRSAAILDRLDHDLQDTACTDAKDLAGELSQIRAQGYAIHSGRYQGASESAWGVAAPIIGALGEPVAVLCLWGPDRRGGRARSQALGVLVRRAAQALAPQ
jgi:IclR family transcriptional regulator, acetate operon repressor